LPRLGSVRFAPDSLVAAVRFRRGPRPAPCSSTRSRASASAAGAIFRRLALRSRTERASRCGGYSGGADLWVTEFVLTYERFMLQQVKAGHGDDRRADNHRHGREITPDHETEDGTPDQRGVVERGDRAPSRSRPAAVYPAIPTTRTAATSKPRSAAKVPASGSHQTRRWRKMDSNHRSLARKSRFLSQKAGPTAAGDGEPRSPYLGDPRRPL
jgi:hypothetical protein